MVGLGCFACLSLAKRVVVEVSTSGFLLDDFLRLQVKNKIWVLKDFMI